MRYIVSTIQGLKKQFSRLFLGVLLGATFIGGMGSEDLGGGFKNLLTSTLVVAFILFLFDGVGLLFSGMGQDGANPSTEQEPPGIMAFNLGVAAGSGVVIGAVVHPLFGFWYTIGVLLFTNGLIFSGEWVLGCYMKKGGNPNIR